MERTIHITAPVLVFGGPYSNLRALQAMRARADALGFAPSQVICTGDIAAYCAEPEETIQAVREWGCHVVAGNCEEQLAQDADDCGCGFDEGTLCNRLAQDWYSFARWRISATSKTWMAALPSALSFKLEGARVRVVHGGTARSNRFIFASDRQAMAEEFAMADSDVVIGGHAGVPFISENNGKIWFNPGVIGMPANDGTPDVWYGLIETAPGDLRLSTHRLAYDHAGAAAAMHAAGLADEYATALTTGLWPSLDILPPHERTQTGRHLDERIVRFATRRALSVIAAALAT